jgi:hypothetical protein
MTTAVRPVSEFLACLYGPVVWAAHFFVVYGSESIVCTGSSSPASTMWFTTVGMTAIALAAIAAPLARSVRVDPESDPEARRFLMMLRNSLAILSAAAVLAVAVSALRLNVCVSPAG